MTLGGDCSLDLSGVSRTGGKLPRAKSKYHNDDREDRELWRDRQEVPDLRSPMSHAEELRFYPRRDKTMEGTIWWIRKRRIQSDMKVKLLFNYTISSIFAPFTKNTSSKTLLLL